MKITDYPGTAHKLFDEYDKQVYNRLSRVKRSITRLILNVQKGEKSARNTLKQYYKMYQAEPEIAPRIRTPHLLLMPFMADKFIRLYNGKTYCKVRLPKEGTGRYISEFIQTRTQGQKQIVKKGSKTPKNVKAKKK